MAETLKRKTMEEERKDSDQKRVKISTTGSVLCLGCGMVAPPMIDYLSARGISVTLATRTISKVENVKKILAGIEVPSGKRAPVEGVAFDFEKEFDKLEPLVQRHDLTVSLLPYAYHVKAAQLAIKNGKHFCTASYVSPAMAELDASAKEAGVILLNECGVDPGLDHMSAQKIIDEVHEKQGRIVSFTSICGGLPAPQFNDNPFGYKFSWSPRGVLLAGRNPACFLRDGRLVELPGKQLYDNDSVIQDHVEGVGNLEWYANRDSVSYRETYNIPEVRSLIRGTYRNLGWCETLKAISLLSFNSTVEMEGISGQTFIMFAGKMLNLTNRTLNSRTVEESVRKAFAEAFMRASPETTEETAAVVVGRLEWLGLFSTQEKVPDHIKTPIDALCHLMLRSLKYEKGEQDMLVMKHTFEIEYNNAHREQITSTMVDFGQQDVDGFSSMARTVSLPLAVAIRAIFDGRIHQTGLLRPNQYHIYDIILPEMEALGVRFVEKVMPPHLWLRDEVKPGEQRVILVPEQVAALKKEGFRMTVERSQVRCFSDEEYAATGCELVPSGSWVAHAPHSAVILGVKELPLEPAALVHRHSFFAHCFKHQSDWMDTMGRFARGKGLLWDLEFLVDEHGRRVATFGHYAGLVGSALALLNFAHIKIANKPLQGPLKAWPSLEALVKDVREKLTEAGQSPRVLVLGALGRCGHGAVWMAEQCGIAPVKWDLEETKGGGPFEELVQFDILVNCVFLPSNAVIPPFLTNAVIDRPDRKLSVISDVSCDISQKNNPLPLYTKVTTLKEPMMRIREGPVPLDVCTIDHLPSLVPAAASKQFSASLVPALLQMKNPGESQTLRGAAKLFAEKMGEWVLA